MDSRELPINMVREIAKHADPSTIRALRAALQPNITRKTIPIGLAVTRVGRPIINIQRPPPINRSLAKVKTPRLPESKVSIDRAAPAAYKNPNWKYFKHLGGQMIIFKNSQNGLPYVVNSKTGARRENKHLHRVLNQGGDWNTLPWQRRTKTHTIQAYYNRMQSLAKGFGGRNAKLNNITRNAHLYRNGNNRALNRWSLSNLSWWARTGPMSYNRNYVSVGKKLYRSGANVPMTRQNLLANIRA